MKIGSIMTEAPVTVSKEQTVTEAAILMGSRGIGAIPVTDNGILCGIVTDRDIVLRCLSRRMPPDSTQIKKIMTADPVFVSPENSVTESSRLMAKHKIRRLPVCRDGHPVGIVSIGDISRSKLMFAETAAAFCDICRDGED